MDANESKSLKTLLASWAAAGRAGGRVPQPPSYSGPDVQLTGFVEHTDFVEPGKCFVARVRTGTDGHPYIGMALDRGASLILGQRPRSSLDINFGETPYLRTEDSAVAEAWLSAAFYEFPSRRLVMIGITGTDGKSTTVNLLHSILRMAGLRVGMLSTIKATLGDLEEPLALHVTTPEAPVVQAYLRRMVDAGLTHCVLEVTSHGLAQHRVDAVEFDVAVVTNITHEHLDYHGDYESYMAAKASLFRGLAKSRTDSLSASEGKRYLVKTAVLNRDDSSHRQLAAIPMARRLNYGLTEASDVFASDISSAGDSTRFVLNLTGNEDRARRQAIDVNASLPGRFNLYNMLAAAATAYALGIKPWEIRQGLEVVRALSGRMELVNLGQPFKVVIDFAHTPNALAQAIKAAREMTPKRIIAVFGSAGKRDVTKRRLMAEIAAREADLVVLTAEDPRTESLESILETMADGCKSQGAIENATYWRVPDRGKAIYFALTLAENKDLVLVCGKGHEQSMCFGTIEYPWDDVRAARTALGALLAGEPMPDLGLPTFTD